MFWLTLLLDYLNLHFALYVNQHQSHVNVRWDNFEIYRLSEGDFRESVVIFNVFLIVVWKRCIVNLLVWERHVVNLLLLSVLTDWWKNKDTWLTVSLTLTDVYNADETFGFEVYPELVPIFNMKLCRWNNNKVVDTLYARWHIVCCKMGDMQSILMGLIYHNFKPNKYFRSTTILLFLKYDVKNFN